MDVEIAIRFSEVRRPSQFPDVHGRLDPVVTTTFIPWAVAIAEAPAMACCHDSACSSAASPNVLNSPKWRRVLWIALVINAGFFVAEIAAGAAAGSTALQADALDFFGDAANYAISLGVAGMALAWRSRAAAAKGGTLLAFALWVLGSTAWHAFYGTLPRAEVMGVVGVAALIANGGAAVMLYRFRTGDANMRSVWICSRNDAVGNAAIEAADANSGLKVLQSNVRIDLLITDVGLPGSLTGLQMVDAARIDRPDLKVLCITGYPLKVATQAGGLQTDMQMLTKPFTLETLANRVVAIIGKS